MSDEIPSLWDRKNLGKWAVPTCRFPRVTAGMLATPSLTFSKYDMVFQGQIQRTTYFDTQEFSLREARKDGKQYVTLRVRCYQGSDGEAYTLSAKTEGSKYRLMIEPTVAETLITASVDVKGVIASLLPSDIQARLLALEEETLKPVVCVEYRRYAVEDEASRLTLDCDIKTDSGKMLHYGILEWKSKDGEAPLPTSIQAIPLCPAKISKFLWATSV